MTRIVDRRCTAEPAVDAEAEDDRLARRRAVREAAAKRDLELAPAKMAEADIAASESRCDAAADDHARLCQPWQDELAALELAAIQRIGNREPPNVEEDERRAELTRMIAEATGDLETSIAAERELQGIARQKARRTREGHPPSDVILMALARPPLANPQLLALMHICQQQIKWLQARLNAAAKSLEIHRYNERETRAGRMRAEMEIINHKNAIWEAERAAVDAELAAAMAESQKIHQQLIAE